MALPILASPPADTHSLPVYERITDALRSAIRRRALPRGTVLLEGPIATIFRSSRSPVRQALTQLHAEGLISRFEGRGMIVGKGDDEALRLSIDAAMLGLEDALGDFARVPAWQRVYDRIENDLVNQSVLGASRINEFELAQHYLVSRTVANQVMLRAEANGIVARDDVGRWSIVPMDTKRLRNIYDVRRLLEPEAIYSVVRHARPETGRRHDGAPGNGARSISQSELVGARRARSRSACRLHFAMRQSRIAQGAAPDAFARSF